MSTDYHRGRIESIPTRGDIRPLKAQQPNRGHYSPDSGDWDGQLPHADVARFAKNQSDVEAAKWPSLLQRLDWATAMTRTHQLSPPQAAVLKEVAYRDGQGRGCTAAMETIALDTGYNEKSIRTAIKGLQERGLISAHGRRGQKKVIALPVRGGQLMCPTPDSLTEVSAQGREPTPVTDSEANRENHTATPVRNSGVRDDPGKRFRSTPVRDSEITRTKQETEREEGIYFSLSGGFNSGSPVTDTGAQVEGPKPDKESIVDLVLDNWPLLDKTGWKSLGAATKHYELYGLAYLQTDLRLKRESLEREDLAARTCLHCDTVHESPEKLWPCPICEGPKCYSQHSPCFLTTCRVHPNSRNRRGASSTHRRKY